MAAGAGAGIYPRRLTVKSGEHTAFVEVSEVDYIEAAGNYAILHVGATNHILRETLANLEAKLSPKRFLRVSRSAIVNLDRVKAGETRDARRTRRPAQERPGTGAHARRARSPATAGISLAEARQTESAFGDWGLLEFEQHHGRAMCLVRSVQTDFPVGF
jgi:hypothetical protein